MSIIKSAYIDGNSFGIIDNSKLNDDPAVHARFASVTNTLRDEQKKRGAKELSLYVDDFLYASCIMMHAAESSLVNQETGEVIKNATGKPVSGWFEKYDGESGRETARWVSPDGVRPTKNNNGDIFPESELLKAYKNWIGKPLCKDHVSSSVDGIRGVIVDTFYDPKFKRVHALFALDKKNYPDLARKIEAGYATNVSMGTAVGRSVCSECQNVATVASEFCGHVKARTHYGEINFDLNPIELSIVVTGADPRAKIRKIVASLNDYRAQADELRKAKGAPLEEIDQIDASIKQAANAVEEMEIKPFLSSCIEVMKTSDKSSASFENAEESLVDFLSIEGNVYNVYSNIKDDKDLLGNLVKVLAGAGADDLVDGLNTLRMKDAPRPPMPQTDATKTVGSVDGALSSLNGTIKSDSLIGEIERETPISAFDAGTGPGLQQFAALYTGSASKKDAQVLEKTSNALVDRITSIKNSLDSLKSCLPTQKAGVGTGDIMTFDELRKRANLRKKSYMQGTEEPKAYAPMGNPDLRDEDHHLHGEELDTSVANPDQKTKELLLRASLEARRTARAEKLKAIAETTGVVVKGPAGKPAGVIADRKFVPAANAYDGDDGDDVDDGDDKDLKTAEAALVRRLEILKEAAKKKAKNPFLAKKDEKKDPKKDAKKPSKKDEEDEEDEKAMAKAKASKTMKKKAYPQGTEEPTSYAPMGDPGLRDSDHHLDGEVLDTKAANPDQKIKELIQRAGLKARLTKSANVAGSRWSVLAGDKEVFSVTASDAYNVHLNKQSDVAGKTWGDLFVSPEYGKQLMAQIRAGRISKLAAELDAAKQSATDVPEAPAAPMAPAAPAPMVEPAEEGQADAASDDMKSKLIAAMEKLEECMANLKDVVMGRDEGVDNVDVDASALGVTASMNRNMFEAHSELASLASEMRFLVTEADLTSPKVRLAARAAIRDGHLAAMEANERIAEFAQAKENAYVLDDEELDQVSEEVEEAIEKHVDGEPEHEDIEKALEALREELASLEEKVEDFAEEVKEDEDEAEADAMDCMADTDMAKRAAMRKQLVARAAKMDLVTSDPMLNVHGKGEGKLDFGTKTTGDADSDVQSVFEAQEMAMKTVSEGVKKAAAGIASAIRQGTLKESQLESLVAVAAVDAAAVKYYLEYFGKVDTDFAKSLTSDFKKSASSNEDIGFRYKRAYAVAIDAQARGLISQGRAALDECADTLATGNDSNFDSFKRMVSNVKPQSRTAGVVPQMGVVDGADSPNTRTASSGSSVDVRDWRSLGKALFDI